MKTDKQCIFCKEGIKYIDYKDIDTLRNFITPQAKIASRRRSGNCSKHQRSLAQAIKRSRILALLPFVSR